MHKSPKKEAKRKACQPPRGQELRMVYLAMMVMAERLKKVEARLSSLTKQGGRIMATLEQILTSVEAEDTVDDSIIALLRGIKKQLDEVLAGGLTPPQQAKVDAIFAKVEASKAKVEAAVLENTPADPEPPA